MESLTSLISHSIAESAKLKQALLGDQVLINKLDQVIQQSVDVFRADGKILFCGNGGSAADAQHLAAEFSGRFYYDRPPLFAEALHVNTSYLTAVGNDYGYDHVYARMLKAMGRKGDVLFALSTSGNSKNILLAAKEARLLNMTVIGMTGKGGGELASLCDVLIDIPSEDTPRIQECHMLLGHIICEQVERLMFPKDA